MLGTFWQADDTADEVRVIEIETWLDTLGAVTVDQFRAAWVDYQRTGPRTKAGRLYKPDAGAIYRLIHSGQSAAIIIEDRAEFWATQIKRGGFVPQTSMTTSLIGEMVGRGLISGDELRERGIR